MKNCLICFLGCFSIAINNFSNFFRWNQCHK